jgi:hypothetical protein
MLKECFTGFKSNVRSYLVNIVNQFSQWLYRKLRLNTLKMLVDMLYSRRRMSLWLGGYKFNVKTGKRPSTFMK